jgi:hypothetical protein
MRNRHNLVPVVSESLWSETVTGDPVAHCLRIEQAGLVTVRVIDAEQVVFPLEALLFFLYISPVLPGTLGDYRRKKTQSEGNRYKMEAGMSHFYLGFG